MMDRTFGLAVVLAVGIGGACTKDSKTSTNNDPKDKPPPAPTAATDAATNTKPPAAAAADAAPTPAAALDTKPVPDKWWLQPDKHCPAGFALAGNPPPKGHTVYCKNDKYKRAGPVTYWHKNGHKAYEGWQKGNMQVGRWTYYYDNGNKRWTMTMRDDGSLDGTYKRWKKDGTLIGQNTLTNGNGRATRWHDDGTKSEQGMMKHGRRDGVWTSWHKNGQISATDTYRAGKHEGPSVSFDKAGKKLVEGSYKHNRYDGKWTYYDAKTGHIARTDFYRDQRQYATVYYQDGKPLGPATPSKTCVTDDAVSAAVLKATGHGLSKRHRCVHRSEAFPGVVAVGSFAYDRGCATTGWLVDCVYQSKQPSTATILARVGWKRANLANKKAIVRRYIRQIEWASGGSAPYKESDYKYTPYGHGGLKVSVWIRRPSGMRRGWTKDRYVYTFTRSGKVSSRRVETKHGGRTKPRKPGPF